MTGIPSSPRAFVVACICTGATALSGRVGLPAVLVDATLDVAGLLDDLNRTRHGAVVLKGACHRCGATFEPGWDDWDIVPMRPERPDETAAAAGVRFSDGRIVVPLPSGMTLADYRAKLRGALGHLALGRVMDRSICRWSTIETALTQARYARAAMADRAASRFGLVEDLVVVDPTVGADAWRLFWLAVSARLAATGTRRSCWR